MKQDWDGSELSRWWSLNFDELALIETKPQRSRLGFAVQLKMYRLAGRFAEHVGEIPQEPVLYLAEQIAETADLNGYDWNGRTGRRHREEVLTFLGVRRMTLTDRNELAGWLERDICPKATPPSVMIEQVYLWCRDRGIQGPTDGEIERLVRSARRAFEDAFLERISAALNADTVAKMEASLAESDDVTGFNAMKADPGRVGLESILVVAERLSFIRSLRLPAALITGVGAPTVERLNRRVARPFRNCLRAC